MSEKLISLNPDLKRLRDEGYEVEVRHGYLVVHSIPYVTSDRTVALGKIVTQLTINLDTVGPPADHQVWFSGGRPCNFDGTPMVGIGNGAGKQTLLDGLEIDFHLSCKLPGGAAYPDFYAKVTEYDRIISSPAKGLDPSRDARTFVPIVCADEHSVFVYLDTASSRAGIVPVSRRLAQKKIAVIGLGGTGSYILDLVAKTPIEEIHLFDGDDFLQHNAFRAPGAASIDDLALRLKKVTYFTNIYAHMRKSIIAHPIFITDETLAELEGFDFVFLCVDRPSVRALIAEHLILQKIPFVDSGLEVELLNESHTLIGSCRVTTCTAEENEHFSQYVSTGGTIGDDLYASNIQVADLNALCAVLSVIKWKKYCGFYQDCVGEHHSAYAINAHQLTRDVATHKVTP